MKKIDPRVVRTRQALAGAIIRLGLERGFECLTVRAVSEQAGVSHVTFYRHYKNLDDLLLEVIRSALKDLTARIRRQETVFDEILATFKYVEERHQLFRAFVALPLTHAAHKLVREELGKLITARYEARDPGRVPLAVTVNHLIDSSYDMLRLYIDSMDEYTPEQAATMHLDLIVRAAESTTVVLREDWLERHPTHQRGHDIAADDPRASDAIAVKRP